MKLKKPKKRKRVPIGSLREKGSKQRGIKLGDGNFHLPEHEKMGLFVALWNGERCQCRVLNVKIKDSEDSIHSHPWWKPHIGEVMQAIQIFYYDSIFFISNEDGLGMQKVTVGKGMPTASHAQFEKVEILGIVYDLKKWNIEFDFDKSNKIAMRGEKYWKEHDPEHLKIIREMRLGLVAMRKAHKEGTLQILPKDN